MRKIVLVAFAGAALAPIAIAEDARPASGPRASSEQEIVVTASPLDIPLEQTLQGVTVLDRGQVLDTLGAGLGETLESQPGVSSTFFGAGASRPIIRGLGEDRIRVLSAGLGELDAATVSPDHAVTTEGLGAQSIEVLRGAASLAYGGNAVGGVVNVIDGRIVEKAPERPVSGSLYAGATSGTGAQEIAGAVTGAVTGRRGALVLRLDGFDRSSDDFEIPGFALSADKRAEEIAEGVDPGTFARGKVPNSFSEANSGSIGASFVGDWGFVGASYRTTDQLYGIPSTEGPEPGDPFAGPRIDLTQERTELRGEVKSPLPGIASLRGDFGLVNYRHVEIEPSGEAGTVFSNEGHEFRIEAVHAPIAGFKGAFGVTGFQQDFVAIGEEAFLTPTETSNYGVFLVEQGEFGKWLAEGGLRFETREHENVGDPDAAVAPRSRSFDTVSASLGAGYRPTDALFFGVTLSRTERAPTEIELFADGAHLATNAFELGNPDLKKEVAVSIEGAARFSGDRLTATANVYRIGFSDFIAQIGTGEVFVEDLDAILDAGDPGIPLGAETLPVFAFAARDATFTGGEIGLAYALMRDGPIALSVDGAADVVRAEFDGGAGDKDLPRIPPRTITLGFDAAYARLSGRLEWVNVAKQSDVAAFESSTDGYDLINARLSLKLTPDSDALSLILDARNLTDEEARVHTSFVKDLLPRPGRTVRAAIAAKF